MSDKAWATYDTADGRILSVSWQRPESGDFIEITPQMARDFMLGNLRTVAFAVKKEAIESIEFFEGYQQFWNLIPLNGGSQGKLHMGSRHVLLRFEETERLPAVLFATLEGNPSWMVESWKLSWVPNDGGMEAIVEVEHPESYSYYCWMPG